MIIFHRIFFILQSLAAVVGGACRTWYEQN